MPNLVQFAVVQAIERWEKRIRLRTIQVTSGVNDASVLNIQLDYVVKRSQTKGSLVYPLFLTSAQLANAITGLGQ
jgi:phage baseplate assembly protein W